MNTQKPGKPQITPHEPEHVNSRRDPEERPVENTAEARERSFDKTLADSFPTSDPPSTIPDPATTEIVGDDVLTDSSVELVEEKLVDLPAGSWAALSIGDRHLVGTGTSRDEASEDARRNGHTEFSLVCVAGEMGSPEDPMKKAS